MQFRERKQIRLQDYDYSQQGAYFVTVCVANRQALLCSIVGNDALVVPTPIGEIVTECWNNIARLNKDVEIGAFCLMPNHIHGIVILHHYAAGGVDRLYGFETIESQLGEKERRGRRSLQGLMKDFKSVTTRRYKAVTPGAAGASLWQKSYHDHIIRNQCEYDDIYRYIKTNPFVWKKDCYHI